MKLLLIRNSGTNPVVSIRPGYLVAAGLAFVVALGAVGFGAYQHRTSQGLDAAVLVQWQAELDAQERTIQRLRDRSQAEADALGRQLAQVQARLMRMEAMGQRVVEVADLDQGEFSFNEPAAVGGPTSRNSEALALSDLEQSFEQIDARLKGREQELAILESLLSDEEYRDAVALEGRPVRWGWLSSPYGYRVDPITGQRAWHAGVDFAGKSNSDVIAVASGLVTFAGTRQGYGEVVEISHGRGLVTRYGHHASLTVETGQIVKRGDVIGKMGSTGRSTGPHVHFEVEHNGRTVDPTKYLKRG